MTSLGSEPYQTENLLDRVSQPSTLEYFYRHGMERERALLARRLALSGGEVLSVGCGRHPGRHLFPAPAFRLTGVDTEPDRVADVVASGQADAALVGYAGRLGLASGSFDVVLYRLVMHHIVYREPLAASFAEAARLLVPGGALVAIEPGGWHPVGLGLGLANRAGLGVATHGTPDDIPLSPRHLLIEAHRAGLIAELHAVTYAWRRLAPLLQRALHHLEPLGSRPRAARFGHTLLLIARKGQSR